MSTKITNPTFSTSEIMLEELHACFRQAILVVESLPQSLRQGDPSEEAIHRVSELMQKANRIQMELSYRPTAATETLMRTLADALDLAQKEAASWIETMRPEVEKFAQGQRMQRAYDSIR